MKKYLQFLAIVLAVAAAIQVVETFTHSNMAFAVGGAGPEHPGV